MKQDGLADARTAARRFLKATNGQALRVWRSMYEDWSPASACTPVRVKSSTLSECLKRLRDAGAVDYERQGQQVFYRPRKRIRVVLEAER